VPGLLSTGEGLGVSFAERPWQWLTFASIPPHHLGMDRRRFLLTWFVGLSSHGWPAARGRGQMLRVSVKLWIICNRP
jgi:hypothetical protein